MKLGIGLHGDITKNIPAYLAMVKAAGFDSVFDNCNDTCNAQALGTWVNECAKQGLTFENAHCSLATVGCWNFHIWEPGEEGDGVLQVLLHDMENCHICGVPMLVLHVDARSYANNVFEVGRQRFAALVEQAEAYGIRLAIENINCGPYLFRIMEEFPQSHVGFCYDSGHNLCATPETDYSPLFGRLFCCHLHDNHAGGPDETMSIDEHLLPGDGLVDFPKLMGQMRKAGYTGALTLEMSYREHYQKKYSPEQYVAAVYERASWLRDLYKGAQA